jgi:rare lipoprotein A
MRQRIRYGAVFPRHGAGQGAVRLLTRLAAISSLALVLANCANQGPQRSAQQSREIGAFSHPKYGKASPRVVGMDEDAPKGGGRYQVGRPYMVAGRRYVPREKPAGYTATGNASWYGIAFHGRKTANGEVYDRKSITAAHPTMPLPSYARVTNLSNNHSIIVRINDRGPYHGGRIVDVSERTADLLRFRHMGTARVKIDYLGPAALAGSDDQRLVASLSTNGPASTPAGGTAVTQVASATPRESSGSLLSFAATAPEPAPRPAAASPAPVSTGQAQRLVPVTDAPIPPARPFDLDTIGGAAQPVVPGSLPVPNGAARRLASPQALPAYRPTDLAFVEGSDMRTRFGANHPFARIGEIERMPPARIYN